MVFQRPSLRFIAIIATVGLFVLWEIPAARRIATIVLTTITGFDFFYERFRDPSWIGALFRMLAHPPAGATLTVMAIGLTLIYWSTRPKQSRMTVPAIGMVICAIAFAGCLFWYLYDRHFGDAANAASPPTQTTADSPAEPKPLKQMPTAYDVEQRLRAVDAIDSAVAQLIERKVLVRTQDLRNHLEEWIANGSAIEPLSSLGNDTKDIFENIDSVVNVFHMRFPELGRIVLMSSKYHETRSLHSNSINLREEIKKWADRPEMLKYLQNTTFISNWRTSAGALPDWISSVRNELAMKRREYEGMEVYPASKTELPPLHGLSNVADAIDRLGARLVEVRRSDEARAPIPPGIPGGFAAEFQALVGMAQESSEEGTWTPILHFSRLKDVGIEWKRVKGRYWSRGMTCRIEGEIAFTAPNAELGDLEISGLPFVKTDGPRIIHAAYESVDRSEAPSLILMSLRDTALTAANPGFKRGETYIVSFSATYMTG